MADYFMKVKFAESSLHLGLAGHGSAVHFMYFYQSLVPTHHASYVNIKKILKTTQIEFL